MGCVGCATKMIDGKPAGCNSNGGCSTGGCNRLNTFDWLSDVPIAFNNQNNLYEISFNQGSRKDFFRTPNHNDIYEKGETVVVETRTGIDVGTVSLRGELVHIQMKKKRVKTPSNELGKIVRIAEEKDVEMWKRSKSKERETMIKSRVIARDLKLDMKIGQVEYQADGKKATFFYIADGRVDFRELIKIYAREFKVKIEMRQIGARQEAGKIGGLGSCGRELCCSTWLTNFQSVSTAAARYQNLSINQSKLSGQCGRLKCCLNYELDSYLDALQHFPKKADFLKVEAGKARLIKTDIFKGLMFYAVPDQNKITPLSIERVNEILEMNRKGKTPETLKSVEQYEAEIEEIEPSFEDGSGFLTLETLEKTSKRNKRKAYRQKKKKKSSGSSSNNTSSNRSSSNKSSSGKSNQSGSSKSKSRSSGSGSGSSSGSGKSSSSNKSNSSNKSSSSGSKKNNPSSGNKPSNKSSNNNPSGQKQDGNNESSNKSGGKKRYWRKKKK